MALDCRIKDNTVFAPNGNVSNLYQNLEDKLGDKAIELYALTETEEYKNAILNPDENGEMSLEDFLKFSLYKEPSQNFNQEKIDLQLRVGKEGFKKLKNNLFLDGDIIINEDTLTNSEVFTKDEVIYILSNQNTLDNLKEFILQDELDISPVTSVYLSYINQYNNIGIKPYINPNQVKEDVLKITSKAENIEEVYNLINTIEYPSILEAFKTNSIVRNKIIEDSLNTKEVPKEYDENYLELLVLNSLDVSNLEEIENISQSVLSFENRDLINDEFLNLIDSLQSSGLNIELDTYDVLNLSLEDIRNFSQEVYNFSKLPNTENTKSLASQLKNIYKFKESELVNTSSINPNVKSLISLDTEYNEIEIFEDKGYIKHAEGLYQKIDDKYSLDQLYNIVYGKVVRGEMQIPTPSVENIEQLQEPLNTEDVIGDIKNYIKEQTKGLPTGNTNTLEKISIYKEFYQAPKTNFKVSRVSETIPNEEYLKTEFVSNFSRFINYNKLRETDIYNSFLKFFQVTKNGIELRDNSEYTKAHLDNFDLLEESIKNDLLNYSKLSKNLNLGEINEKKSFTTDQQRIFNIQNPNTVQPLDKNYETLNENDIILEDSNDTFVRINEDVYEKTQEYKNISLYSKLPKDDKFYHLTEASRPDPIVNYNDFENKVKQMEKSEEVQVVGDIELEEINQEHFNCN